MTGPPSRAALQSAIAAAAGARRLTVFLIGSGDATHLDCNGNGAASDAADLTPSDLDAWLDALQSTDPIHPTRVTVVLDFSHSGAWLPALAASPGQERVVIASCGADQTASCRAGGIVSFAQWFFGQAGMGASFQDSFVWARNTMRAVTAGGQNPVLDDDGTGTATRGDGALAATTWLGAEFVTEQDTARIGNYAHDVVTTGAQALLWAGGVWAPGGIASVYAVVVAPGASGSGVVRVDLAYTTPRRTAGKPCGTSSTRRRIFR